MSEPTDWREPEPDELEAANPLLATPDEGGGEDYHPGTPRPDLEDKASEADVVDQAYEVELDDDGDEPID